MSHRADAELSLSPPSRPDSFKGTLTASEVAQALGAGLAKSGRQVDLCPVADGGEGTLVALVGAMDAELQLARVFDPLGGRSKRDTHSRVTASR